MKKPALIALAATLSILAACEANRAIVPPISPGLIAAGAAKGAGTEDLATGRRLLATRCTGCHSLEPVASRTPEEWRAVVKDMSERSGLNAKEEEQIIAYLVAARESL